MLEPTRKAPSNEAAGDLEATMPKRYALLRNWLVFGSVHRCETQTLAPSPQVFEVEDEDQPQPEPAPEIALPPTGDDVAEDPV